MCASLFFLFMSCILTCVRYRTFDVFISSNNLSFWGSQYFSPWSSHPSWISRESQV